MKFSFQDVQEIGTTAGLAFIETFHFGDSDSEDSDGGVSDTDTSDLDDWNPNTFGCDPVTNAIEEIVEETAEELCSPLADVYGSTAAGIIQETIATSTEEIECVGIKALGAITPGEDRNLIALCTSVCYHCCCEGIKKVSPIIADACANLSPY